VAFGAPIHGASSQRTAMRTITGWGKMALVLRRETDGNWRMIQETWPPSEPEPDLLPAAKR